MRIGYTTGVFDLFHIGHLNIIQRSKELCDFLIVGVSTDSLVYNYKGHYPVIPYEERFAIISALRYVDRAVSQENLDKFAAWERFHYNILFHGDDWKESQLYSDAKRRLETVGVELVFFPHTEGTSSTKIRNLLNERYKESGI
ncbi:MAG: adenylyltransferase/cytidyltransferase family protein [Oscillibacter sp.]|nr:adenylyltransferase/cytidyltransferase family protein [Oscillibacter sp.]